MLRASLLPKCLLLLCVTWAQGQENHLSEPGSGAIYSRSAFAHGYRHGYEEGYHVGNLDINMGRPIRTKKTRFQGMTSGYSSEFGSKKLFEVGFHAGATAGYADGYSGRVFRAVDSLRNIAEDLVESPSANTANTFFDQGLAAGYRDGFDPNNTGTRSAMPLDFRAMGCPELATEKPTDSVAEGSYCEGYRRGFVLGHADASAITPDRTELEASR